VDIWSADKLALVVFFAIPGFITLKVYGLLSASSNKDTSQQLLDAVAYSCINYAILVFPILSLSHSGIKETSPYCYFALWAVFLLIVPAVIATIYWCFRKTNFAQKMFPHPIGKP
jgi:cytochrome bd-type quinol oxidase subunit 2